MTDAVKLRAWWSALQGLDGSLEGASPAAVLERCGWSRSVGGVGPYLTLFARAGTSRAGADAAVAALAIHEIPCARGCTYVVPASDFAVGLRAGQGFGDQEMKQATKLGVTEDEITKLCAAVRKALAKGPLDPEGIRTATGDASRSLGEAGKKKGLTTTLPLALGRLQESGEIRRVPVNGRLDQQRYQYTLWKPSPFGKQALGHEDALRAMALRWFRSVAPATLAELQWFTGLGKKACAALVEPFGLVPVEDGSERLLLPEQVDAWKKFKVPSKPHYVLVSALDPITANRRDVTSLIDAGDFAKHLPAEKSTAAGSALGDLPNHAILDRGRVVGLWEYDMDASELVARSFVPLDKALRTAIARTEAYVRDELGDARSFSLDSPKSRAPRIAALRGK